MDDDFDIDLDLWVYRTNGELKGKFKASVLSESTVMAIMEDVERYYKENTNA
jgi:hypothetical protein